MRQVRRLADRGRAAAVTAALASGWLIATTGSVAAIPSPELVVGTLSSMSQLFAVLSALLGGGAVAAGARLSGRKAETSRARRWSLAVLGLVAIAAVAGNVYQYASAAADRRARLEATLVRPAARAPDGKLLDEALREMSFDEQRRHPRGMSTEEAAAFVDAVSAGRESGAVLLDIRETAEAEMGSFPGARHVRYPDLETANIDFTGRQALLFCHNGNRSGETCARLAERGIACRFIVGGLEKWLSEGRPIGAGGKRSLADLRALPPFPNDRTLLDTTETRALIETAGAVLVDVRYPGEFKTGHIKGAISLPIRPLPTAELVRRLEALPARPVVVPCYDRRSCFFGEILGLELTRMGRDFRGRYTVPWEYFEAPPKAAYVADLVALQSKGPWARAVAALAGGIGTVAATTGLVGAIVLLALASRLLVLPFSLKAERDQRIAREIGPEVRRLKSTLADDPVRRGRALAALYRERGLTPGRNMLALLFLPLMAMSVEAVSIAAAARPSPLLWLPDLAVPDPYYVVPLAFGILAGAYMSATLASSRRHHALIWGLAVPLLSVAVALLPAAGSFYVLASIALLVAQSWLAGGGPRRIGQGVARRWHAATRARLGHPGIVPLEDLAARHEAGNKAARLADLAATGLPVPRGIVLTQGFLTDFQRSDATARRRHLDRIWRRMGAAKLAVRSSAVGEDGAAHSFAGVFETVLDVDRAGLEKAVLDVLGSFSSARASPYGDVAGQGNVLVQPMVAAEYAGVMFTEDPAAPGAILVEFVAGSGEALVSGRAAPVQCRFGRLTGRRLDGAALPFDPAPLVSLAGAIEARFGRPQDIEWAYGPAGFTILQARDITAAADNDGAERREAWRDLLRRAAGRRPGEPALAQNEMTELLPRPSPCSLSLIEALWAAGGSVDQAARRLGLGYAVAEEGPSLHTTVFGRLYVDAREVHQRALVVGALSARRLRREASAIERSVRTAVVPQILARQVRQDATDLDRLSARDLMAEYRDCLQRFVTEVHTEAEIVNIAARFLHDDARRIALALGVDPDAIERPRALTCEQEALRNALLIVGPTRHAALESAIGHRAAFDYELAQPRYGEMPERLHEVARALLHGPAADDEHGRAPQRRVPLDQVPRRLRRAVEAAQRFAVLKEDAKHHILREFAHLRRLLLAIDRRFALGGRVFELTVEEVSRIDARSSPALAAVAAARHAARGRLGSGPPLAPVLTAVDIEAAAAGGAAATAQGGGALAGTRVSGAARAAGRARVACPIAAESGAPLDDFRDGDIIVSRMVPPAWLPYVLRSGGVVTEVGGWLSHMAIVARERGIAMVVGCRGLERISTGDRLVIEPDGSIVVAEDDEAGVPLGAAAE